MDAKLRARDIYRRMLPAYRAHARVILLAALAVFIPLGALDALEGSIQEDELGDLPDYEVVAVALGLFAKAGTALLGEAFYSAVVVAAVAVHRTGAAPSVREIAKTLPYLRLAIVDVAFALAVGLGTLLFILPGLVLFTWFALAAPLLKLEHHGVRAAFARSREIVRGHFWTAFAVLVPIAIGTDLLAEALSGASIAAAGDSFAGHWLSSVVAELVGNPPYAIAVALLTFALLDREEGRPVS